MEKAWLNINKKQGPLKTVLGTSVPQYTTSFISICKSFGPFLSYSVLVRQCSVLHPRLQKTFWSQIRDGVQAAEGLFFPSNNLIFKKLPTLLSSFCIWNSIYKPVSSFMFFLVYAFIAHNNRRYCLNNKVRPFIKSLGIRTYVLFLCGHAE